MDYRERILALIKLRGPMQPFAVSKELTTNSTLASAMLSEMSDKGLLKVSNIKVGSSPLYFISGQEDQLLRFTSGINEKDKVTLVLLQQEKVLRDSAQEPLTRVSLRSLKDFAKQLEVQHENGTEIFWKWHLATDKEAEPIIRALLERDVPASGNVTPSVPAASGLSSQSAPQSLQSLTPVGVPSAQMPSASLTFAPDRIPAQQAVPKRRARQQSLSQVIPQVASGQLNSSPQVSADLVLSNISKSTPPDSSLPVFGSDVFSGRVKRFLDMSQAEVIAGALIKKGEYVITLRVPTPIGPLSFVCVAKDKKTISDSELSSAYVQAQHKHLPLILLATGDLTKSARFLIQTALPGVVFKKI